MKSEDTEVDFMQKTKIEWCDATHNPITGCLHDCPYCYARGISNRFKTRGFCKLIEPKTHRVTTVDGKELFEINDAAYFYDESNAARYNCPYPHGFKPTLHRYRFGEYKNMVKPRNIFVGSMADVFGEWVPERWIEEVFRTCIESPQHNYLFLTKNPARYLQLEESGVLPHDANMWYGTTVTDPSAEYFGCAKSIGVHTFLSIEPLLEDFGVFGGTWIPEWVIIGAETGNRKNKVVPRQEWIEKIVTQCKQHEIPVFMKDSLKEVWGEELLREFPKELIHA